MRVWTGFIWLCCCEQNNGFLDYLSNYQLLKKDTRLKPTVMTLNYLKAGLESRIEAPGILNTIYLWLSSPLLDLDRFFSFLILSTVGRTPWTGDQHVLRPLPTQNNINTEYRIRTHDTSLPASEDSSCLRPWGHSDRRYIKYTLGNW
jgi:hypothetical protein